MTHEEAFLQEILDNRDDDTVRRIYADWLMDHGDEVRAARGEFIHLQCDLARLTADAPRRAELVRRERELVLAHGREWGSPFLRLGCRCWEYRRGFVEGVGLPAQALLSQARVLFRHAPIRELKLYEASGLLHDIVTCPLLAQVRVLDLEKNELGDADLDAFTTATALSELRCLMLWANRIGDAGVRSLAASRLPRLEQLDLSANIVGDSGAEALADSLFLGRLRKLDLSGNQITDAGGLALAHSPMVQELTWLDLAKNPIGNAGLAALRQRFAGRVHVVG